MRFTLLTLLIITLFILNLYIGSVDIDPSTVTSILIDGDSSVSPAAYIILCSRLPQAITALMAGAALAVSGLMLQTAFRNPLAGPSILGITSGASLGVALVMLLSGGVIAAGGLQWSGFAATVAGALAGSLLVMAVLLALSRVVRNDLLLLIAGIMIGYLASSAITLLNYSATAKGIQGYTLWGMGTFSAVTTTQLPVFTCVTAAGIALAVTMIKPLNLMLLGADYASNLGLDVVKARNMLLVSTGVLTAIVTAYCGPVSFIGLAVPHIARMILRTDDHATLLPGTLLAGAAVALLCNLISVLPSGWIMPLNAVTPLIGAPVVIYVVVNGLRR